MSRWRFTGLLWLVLGGCGDPFAPGSYLGEPRLGVPFFVSMPGDVRVRPTSPLAFLVYRQRAPRRTWMQTIPVPADFVGELAVYDPPPESLREVWPRLGQAGPVALASWVLTDDRNEDSAIYFENGRLQPPDELLGVTDEAVLFAYEPAPEDPLAAGFHRVLLEGCAATVPIPSMPSEPTLVFRPPASSDDLSSGVPDACFDP